MKKRRVEETRRTVRRVQRSQHISTQTKRRELRREVDRAHAAIDHAAKYGSHEAYITWDSGTYRPLANRVARALRREGYHVSVAREVSGDMGLVLSIHW